MNGFPPSEPKRAAFLVLKEDHRKAKQIYQSSIDPNQSKCTIKFMSPVSSRNQLQRFTSLERVDPSKRESAEKESDRHSLESLITNMHGLVRAIQEGKPKRTGQKPLIVI